MVISAEKGNSERSSFNKSGGGSLRHGRKRHVNMQGWTQVSREAVVERMKGKE